MLVKTFADITSLFYYLANKNYVSITFIDEDDSLLTKLCRELPDWAQNYQNNNAKRLFKKQIFVFLKFDDNIFYQTVQEVVNAVNINQFVSK